MSKGPRGDADGWARAGLPTPPDGDVSRETSTDQAETPDPDEPTSVVEATPASDAVAATDTEAVQEAVRQAMAKPVRQPAPPPPPAAATRIESPAPPRSPEGGSPFSTP